MSRLDGFVDKGWGNEYIFATNDLYCGKLLRFNEGSKFSMHFHREKDETWYVLSGEFIVRIINTRNAQTKDIVLKEGDTWRNEPCEPHQLICIQEGTIIEVSTPDSVEDNYRVAPGDSQ
jgi:mannose-6-phosphate isomerase-like protein (cupin superfamily)